MKYIKYLILQLLLVLFVPDNGSLDAEPVQKEINYFYKEKSSWDIFLYGGRYTETDLLPILFRQDVKYKKSDLVVVGLSRPLDYRMRNLRFEVEGNLGKHFGIMNHWEVNGLFVARIKDPFDLPMSFAIGEGLSLASMNPRLENKAAGFDFENFTYQTQSISSRNLLNFVMVEWEFGKEEWNFPRIFLRVHHRSGVFGLYCKPDPACGSNFITYGIRYPLNSIFHSSDK